MDTLEQYWRQLQATNLAEGWWVVRNLGLALVPLGLAAVLFRRQRRRPPLWWAGVAVFLAFLPNAPYVLADVTWFLRDVRWVDEKVAAFVLIPLYGGFFLTGFTSYAVSLLWVGDRLAETAGRLPAVVSVNGTHLIAAVGIYLGRSHDLNSWDLVARPADVGDALVGIAAHPSRGAVVVAMAGALAVAAPAYQWLLRAVAAQLRHRQRARRPAQVS